jgi:hypothetical protein
LTSTLLSNQNLFILTSTGMLMSTDSSSGLFNNSWDIWVHRLEEVEDAIRIPIVPSGTPFFIQYLKANDEERFGIYGTDEVDATYYKRIQQKFNTYLATKVIPKMGRSILRDGASRFGAKSETCTEVRYDGTVCGGIFRRDTKGEYVCQDCGIIYAREDNFVADDTVMDEDTLEENTTQKDLEIGGMLPASMQAVESRLSRNLAKFRASVSKAPKDEVEAKARAHSDKERHEKAKLAFVKLGGHVVYENKWVIKTRDYRRFKAITLIKDGGMTTGKLMGLLDMGTRQFYQLIASLEESGRIRSEKAGKTTKLIFVQ